MATFATLKTSLSDRGFSYLSDTRLGEYVNLGYTRVCEAHPWIWTQATATGNAPLTIATLGQVLSVVDTTNKTPLTVVERDEVIDDMGADLTVTGTPSVAYRSAETVVSVYPVATVALSVRHCAVPAALTGTDTPILPSRYHLHIVDAAVVEAYLDADDPAAAGAEAVLEKKLDRMRDFHDWNRANPGYMQSASQDY